MSQGKTRTTRRQIVDGMLWLVAALVATYAGLALPLPYKVIAPLCALAAVVAAIRIFRLAARGKDTMLVWIAGTAGLVGALFYGGIATSQIILWEPTVAYERCLAQALTETAAARCQADYTTKLWD